MNFKWSKHSLAQLKTIDTRLAIVLNEALATSKIDFRVEEGKRSATRQGWLYASGRTRAGKILTYKDGVKTIGRHQKGKAADIVPIIGREANWKAEVEFIYLGKHIMETAERLGIKGVIWGGKWKMADLPHYEIIL